MKSTLSARGLTFLLLLALLSSDSLLIGVSASDQNLVNNGDFSEGLKYWRVVTVSGYPHIIVDANKRLVMGVPFNYTAYVYQRIKLPEADKATLSLRAWRSTELVAAGISIVTGSDEKFLEIFEPEMMELIETEKIFIRTYDITEFAGQEIELRLWGSGLGSGAASFVYFDDVQIKISGILGIKRSLITINLSGGHKIGKHTMGVHKGRSLTVYGRVFPEISAKVKLEFTRPDGSKVINYTESDSSGFFRWKFVPDSIGIWRVSASWPGSDNIEGDVSPPKYFVVTEGYNYCLLISGKINDFEIKVEDPEIQVRPGEEIRGTIRVRSFSPWRYETAVLVGLNNWERDKWSEIAWWIGLTTPEYEPIGFKILQFSKGEEFIPIDFESGGFSANLTWKIGEESPLKAPVEEGNYYILAIQGAVLRAEETIEEFKPWDLSPEELEERIKRSHAMGIRVVVVDVDPVRNKSRDLIQRATDEDLPNLSFYRALLRKADQFYGDRDFIDAKKIYSTVIFGNASLHGLEEVAVNLGHRAEERINKMREKINEMRETFLPLVVSEFEEKLAEAKDLYNKGFGNYRKAEMMANSSIVKINDILSLHRMFILFLILAPSFFVIIFTLSSKILGGSERVAIPLGIFGSILSFFGSILSFFIKKLPLLSGAWVKIFILILVGSIPALLLGRILHRKGILIIKKPSESSQS